MRKVWVIARRDFLAAVRSKAFVLTILFMPILMGISVGVQLIFAKMERAKTKHVVVLDRTPGQKLGSGLKKIGDELQKSSKAIEQVKGLDPMIRDMLKMNVQFESIEPKVDPDERQAQLFELSQKLENGEVEVVVEIGADAAQARSPLEKALGMLALDADGMPVVDLSKIPESETVILRSKATGAMQIRLMIQTALNQAVLKDRFEKKGIAAGDVEAMLQPLTFRNKSLIQRDDSTGKLVERSDEAAIASMIVPIMLIALMFMAIMIGATPAMHGVIEEKSMRIAEVLLGSVAPFQLMAGKLIGVIGVSLSIAFVYLGGSYVLALYFGFASLLPTAMLAWFFPMLVLAMLIFGSLFIAVGAAATDIKDTQTLLMPIMMIACIPFFALGPIIQEPNGTIARVCSFFPFASPMLLTARQASPPGVPTGELIACIAVVLLTTVGCVWAAGRIFRIGILMQGKSPKFIELVKWAIKG